MTSGTLHRRALVLTFFAIGASAPRLASAAKAVAVSVSGDVFVQEKGLAERRLYAGENIPDGAKLRTGEDGALEMLLEDNSKLKLRPKSRMKMTSLRAADSSTKTTVLLFMGRVWSQIVGGVSGKVKYEVRTGNAVCGVRGTVVENGAGEDGSMMSYTEEGTTQVSDSQNNSQELGAGSSLETTLAGNGEVQDSPPDWGAFEAAAQQRVNTNAQAIMESNKKKLEETKSKLQDNAKEQEGLKQQLAEADPGSEEAEALQSQLGALQSEAEDLSADADTLMGTVSEIESAVNDDSRPIENRDAVQQLVNEANSMEGELSSLSNETGSPDTTPTTGGDTNEGTDGLGSDDLSGQTGGGGKSALAQAGVARIKQILMNLEAKKAQAAGDDIKGSCIQEQISAVSGYASTAETASAAVEASEARADYAAAERAYVQVQTQVSKAEQAGGKADRCQGAINDGAEGTQVETVISEETEQDTQATVDESTIPQAPGTSVPPVTDEGTSADAGPSDGGDQETTPGSPEGGEAPPVSTDDVVVALPDQAASVSEPTP